MRITRSVSRLASAFAAAVLAGAAASCGDGRIIAPDTAGARASVLASTCPTPLAIVMNQTVNETITQSDCEISTGRYADVYTVTVNPGGTIRLHMSSDQLNAYVIVTSSTGTTWTDDDSGPGTGSRLEVTLTAGTYTVHATSSAGGVGVYRLWIGRDAPPVIGNLTVGAKGHAVDQSVTHSEWMLPRGTYGDVYRFTLAAATNVRVNMMGDAFEPYVLLRGITNTAVSFIGDTTITGFNTDLSVLLQAGTYEIRATSLSPDGGGSYRLWVGPRAAPTQQISLGAVVDEDLSSADWLMPRRTHADVYTLTLASATTLRIGMASNALNPYITVLDGTTSTSYVDDDSGVGNDAVLIQQLPAGTYQVRATTSTLWEDGAYRLAVDVYRAPQAICTSNAIPAGYVVISATSSASCPGGSAAGINRYSLVWPYGDETVTMCSAPTLVPSGWVIVSAGSSTSCPSSAVTSTNTFVIKVPDDAEEVCNASVLPAGYVIVAQGYDPACPNSSSTQPNTWFIERT